MALQILRRYYVPGYGSVVLMHDSFGRSNGEYYSLHPGSKSPTIAINCESEAELMQKTGELVQRELKVMEKSLETKLQLIQQSLEKMTINSQSGLLLKDFE